MTNKLDVNNLTKSEEDYLKGLFQLLMDDISGKVGNNQLAEYLKVSPASANSMLKKLKTKKYASSEKYGKLELTEKGRAIAVSLIRKHRLWETFLCNYLNFTWDEVHEVAEQLEHIKSQKLINELDSFMDFPTKDPHGEMIPNSNGEYSVEPKITLSSLIVGSVCQLVSVNDASVTFLKYVSEIGLVLSSEIKVMEIRDFDKSIKIRFNNTNETVTRKFADNIFVKI